MYFTGNILTYLYLNSETSADAATVKLLVYTYCIQVS